MFLIFVLKNCVTIVEKDYQELEGKQILFHYHSSRLSLRTTLIAN